MTENLAEGLAIVISDDSVVGDFSATADEAIPFAWPISTVWLGIMPDVA